MHSSNFVVAYIRAFSFTPAVQWTRQLLALCCGRLRCIVGRRRSLGRFTLSCRRELATMNGSARGWGGVDDRGSGSILETGALCVYWITTTCVCVSLRRSCMRVCVIMSVVCPGVCYVLPVIDLISIFAILSISDGMAVPGFASLGDRSHGRHKRRLGLCHALTTGSVDESLAESMQAARLLAY